MICLIIYEKLSGNIIQGMCSGDQVKVFIVLWPVQGYHYPRKADIIQEKLNLLCMINKYFYRIHLIQRIKQKSEQK